MRFAWNKTADARIALADCFPITEIPRLEFFHRNAVRELPHAARRSGLGAQAGVLRKALQILLAQQAGDDATLKALLRSEDLDLFMRTEIIESLLGSGDMNEAAVVKEQPKSAGAFLTAWLSMYP